MQVPRTLYISFAFLLRYTFNVPLWLIPVALLGLYAVTGGHKFLYVFCKTIKRDASGYFKYRKVMREIGNFEKRNMTVPAIFEENVQKHPNKICFHSAERTWSFKEINELSNKIAHIFQEAGFKPGDAIGLQLENRPEYAAIWLGLSKAGLVGALINYNLRDKSLLHSINIVESKAVIFGTTFTDAIEGIKKELDPSVKLYEFDRGASNNSPGWAINLDALLKDASPGPLSSPPKRNYSDSLAYIYTSGTTGLPKAAIIRHSRFIFTTTAGFLICKLRVDDTIYVYLPLYHMSGGVMGIGMSLLFGSSCAIRSKFSASNFWTDCIRYECTATQYLGEVCRYLLAAPPKPEDRAHKVRVFYGAGLRPQIWNEFKERFNIESVSEYYGASEGNANIVNIDETPGAVGFISRIAPYFYPITIVKMDQETGELIRGPDGLCIRCEPNEPGMFISVIQKGNPTREFHGYADKKATEKKIARNVLEQGDAAFLSGDVLYADELGYLYFVDRTGDTFRWRGENVSTAEVEAVISNSAQLRDCCVYGVEVPGCEGRAGMAAIMDPDKNLDLKDLASQLTKVLPAYARPLFIRVLSAIEMTGTYKMKKTDYQKEGFDLSKVKGDALFFLEASSQSYVPLTDSLYQKLASGQMRL